MAHASDQTLQVMRTIPGPAGLLAGEYSETREALRRLVALIAAGADMVVIAGAADDARRLLPDA